MVQLFESRLEYEEMELKNPNKKLETHIFNLSYREDKFDEIMEITNHIIFDSFNRWKKFKSKIKEFKEKNSKKISCGLRLNPEFSEVETEIYNPAGKFSRFGVTLENFKEDEILKVWMDFIFMRFVSKIQMHLKMF